jgi:hypothetical protein
VLTAGISNGVNLTGKHNLLWCFHFSVKFLGQLDSSVNFDLVLTS